MDARPIVVKMGAYPTIMNTSSKALESTSQTLGKFLQDRRTRLDAASFGFAGRRRTPGLRREEVAHRANISSAWYVCLEQGRGGAPSADVLDRLARALLLTDAEREHLFLIGLGRAPESHFRKPDGIDSRLQRVLDRLNPAPAMIKTATWDVVAWNEAASVFWPGLTQPSAQGRNTLRMVFLDPDAHTLYPDWEAIARMSVATFRADVTRAGATGEVAGMIDELSRSSPAFKAMWLDNAVSDNGHAVKSLWHPKLGTHQFEASTFGVDGRQDLALIVFMPIAEDAVKGISHLLKRRLKSK